MEAPEAVTEAVTPREPEPVTSGTQFHAGKRLIDRKRMKSFLIDSVEQLDEDTWLLELIEKETLKQFEDESNAEFLLRQEELNLRINDLQKEQLNNRINNIGQQTELITAFNGAWVSGVDLLNSKSAESAEFQKTMALINIGVQTANALAQIVAIATSPLDPSNLLTGGLAAPIKILSLSGVVLSNMANAKKMLSAKPKGFATGVIDLQGPGTTTSDSIPAYLSRGESVMTAKATEIFKPQLAAMNGFA